MRPEILSRKGAKTRRVSIMVFQTCLAKNLLRVLRALRGGIISLA